MKKHIRFVSAMLLCVVFGLMVSSCKKGDGDPFFSLYTRKARITNEWKMSSFNELFTYQNIRKETTYDGSSKKVDWQTTVSWPTPTPHDTVFYSDTTYKGTITNNIKSNGTYNYIESFTEDLTQIVRNYEITGLWYFMGANQQNGFKNKELVSMQVTNFVYNPTAGNAYTTIHQGEHTLDVYEIYALKSKELVLKLNRTETINFVKYTTTCTYTYKPK